MGHKGHWGEYTGNAKWSRDHAHTKVTSKNYDDAVKDDAAHIDYLKRDVIYDDHHGHSDEKMTADEKHISKLAGDMKYDKEHHGSAAKNKVEGMTHAELAKFSENRPVPAGGKTGYERHMEMHNSAVKKIDPREDKGSYEYDYDFDADRKASKRKSATQMHCTPVKKNKTLFGATVEVKDGDEALSKVDLRKGRANYEQVFKPAVEGLTSGVVDFAKEGGKFFADHMLGRKLLTKKPHPSTRRGD